MKFILSFIVHTFIISCYLTVFLILTILEILFTGLTYKKKKKTHEEHVKQSSGNHIIFLAYKNNGNDSW